MDPEAKWMTPYEQFEVADKVSRRPNGTSITALVLGGGALIGTIAGWIANACANKQTSRAIDRLADYQYQDRQRVFSTQPTVFDLISVTSNPLALSGATSRAASFNAGGYYGNGAANPLPVALYQPAMPCSCNTCGCNG